MTANTKVLIPNKEWIIKQDNTKIGSIAKAKKGYLFVNRGRSISFKNLTDIHNQLGINIEEENLQKLKENIIDGQYSIYGFPCSSKPYEPIYNIKKKLPIFAKSDKSKSQYCAGYYTIKFRKGWVKSFCPKLITLERYPYYGPFSTENEMKTVLNTINKP